MEEIPAPPLQTYSLSIYYGTQTGTAKQFSQQLARAAEARGITTSVCDLKDCDPEDTLTQEVRREGGRGGGCKDSFSSAVEVGVSVCSLSPPTLTALLLSQQNGSVSGCLKLWMISVCRSPSSPESTLASLRWEIPSTVTTTTWWEETCMTG